MELFARDRRFWRTVVGAVFVGTVGAGAALLFTTVVRLGTDALWPEEIDYDLLGGDGRWIAITTAAGLLVGVLRRVLRVPDEPSASLAMIQEARTDYRTAVQTIVVSAVSLIGGASLGPFDAGTRSGGAVGAWYSARWNVSEEEREVNTLSGIGGALGGLLTAPFLATMLVTELRRPDPSRYYRVLIPNLTGAVFGFFVYFTVVGDTFLGVFNVPGYDVRAWHFGAAVGLGFVAAVIAWILGLTVRVVQRLAVRFVPNQVARPAVGGLIIGLIAVVVPLTLASGKEQLNLITSDIGAVSGGVMVAVVFGKILAMAVSLGTGFIGGPVMPTLFIGGAAGLAIHILIPDLPVALTFSAMLVAVPGTAVKAPFTMLLLAGLTVGVGPADGAPAGVAVVVAYLMTSGLGLFGVASPGVSDPDDRHHVEFRDELFDVSDAASPEEPDGSSAG